ERLMIKHADLIICDSKGIESYIHEQYGSYNPKTTYIAYRADLKKSLIKDSDEVIIEWFNKYKIKEKEYYLIVGRFVPENN
ncbi:DUF1972 domain-containing protein, partial [Bifidobacterium longum]|uniref:DUF1972 domain-containing protein n=1 Tax=Bifidobacterium longum TaxID=216816 RepID=UPI001EE10D41